MADAHNRVVFDKGNSYILDKRTGLRTQIEERKEEKERKKKNRQAKIRDKWIAEEKEAKEKKKYEEVNEEMPRREEEKDVEKKQRKQAIEELVERFPYEEKSVIGCIHFL